MWKSKMKAVHNTSNREEIIAEDAIGLRSLIFANRITVIRNIVRTWLSEIIKGTCMESESGKRGLSFD